MNLTPAQSQKADERPISFILDAVGGDIAEVRLFIRPEDMTRTHPSRTTVNQTLGGAWVDSFGEGLATTTISGTLGWRTGPDGQDGAARLIELRDQTYVQWHALRQEAVNRGENPSGVKLRFVDSLNSYSTLIVPLTWEIRRSKSRPLLASYRISFIAVGSSHDPGVISLASDLFGGAQGFGLSSLFSSLNEINSAINSAKNFVDRNILGPVTGFMNLSTQVFTTVHDTIKNGLSVGDQFIGVARGIALTGVNVFRTLAAVANVPQDVKAELMQVAGAYSNTFCLLKNALSNPATYEEYTPLYGSSNCSSTSGGAPISLYADANPFFAVSPGSTSAVSVSPAANTALQRVAGSDVVLSPVQTVELKAALTDINAGVVLQ